MVLEVIVMPAPLSHTFSLPTLEGLDAKAHTTCSYAVSSCKAFQKVYGSGDVQLLQGFRAETLPEALGYLVVAVACRRTGNRRDMQMSVSVKCMTP
jgi:hypothetical protein